MLQFCVELWNNSGIGHANSLNEDDLVDLVMELSTRRLTCPTYGAMLLELPLTMDGVGRYDKLRQSFFLLFPP